jgi:hypothetical protein
MQKYHQGGFIGVNMAVAKIIISAKMNCDLEVFSR